MSPESLNSDGKYTYFDYITWDDEKRYELIDGIPYMMSPAPTQRHQEVSGALFNQFYTFLKGQSCKIFSAPFDVRLNVDCGDDTVFQPDLLIVCDHSKLDGKCCKGAPDLVIEIVSPSTARTDRVIKYQKYLAAGVKEYWIVEPDTKTIQVCILENGRYYMTAYDDTASVTVSILEGLQISLPDVFAE